MLCRVSKLKHPSYDTLLRTPLLIPSFSSKAFGFSRNGLSDVLSIAGELLTKTCLVSAYDIYYKYIPVPERLGVNVDLMFMDSGGFEAEEEGDLSEIYRPAIKSQDWDRERMAGIARIWPEEIPAVFVSYDHPDLRHSVSDQINLAKVLRNNHCDQMHSFLLKPENPGEPTLLSVLKTLDKHLAEIADLDFIGATEKELGFSILERMVRIAKLRQTLDREGLLVPIHVFGTLDPLSVILYFIAGAEVFDGLTWFRYAYNNNNQCIYIQNNCALNYGIEVPIDEMRVRTLADNLKYLEQLERTLNQFVINRTWDIFGAHSKFIRSAAQKLNSELGGL